MILASPPGSKLSQSDTGSEKEDPLSPCQPPALRPGNESSDEPSAVGGVNGRHRAARHPTRGEATPPDLSPASHREAGEGWDREQAKRLEERNRWFEEGLSLMEMTSRWDSMELKKASDATDSELNRKWEELERVSFRDMTPQSLMGAPTHQSDRPREDGPPLPRLESCPSGRDHAPRPASRPDDPRTRESPPAVNGSRTAQSRAADAHKEVGQPTGLNCKDLAAL